MADHGIKRNKSGYNDPTAYKGMMAALREETDQQRRLTMLINVLKYIIDLAGYDLLHRIEVKDRRTGKEYR
jgi:hypothetical protein